MHDVNFYIPSHYLFVEILAVDKIVAHANEEDMKIAGVKRKHTDFRSPFGPFLFYFHFSISFQQLMFITILIRFCY